MSLIAFSKGESDKVSANTPHFNCPEFECKCNSPHDSHIALELVLKLEDLRTACGTVPIKINSAYRCFDHNKAVGGSKDSKHMKGIAADIVVTGIDPRIVAVKAAKIGFTGIGIYKTFTHVDTRPGPLRAWTGD